LTFNERCAQDVACVCELQLLQGHCFCNKLPSHLTASFLLIADGGSGGLAAMFETGWSGWHFSVQAIDTVSFTLKL